ncbi:sigma 54-interacting transcriptional regulator [Jeotgalibacillus proteolyticus]|uniref:Sigma-54-dependent Fis family transcriptional regulator n=1 Tax=Jeotgalibacillus proteolyticus TaxID=2082395 RepID=A0A2S5GAF3_9BACL|nr:sigma 54-interacting transcriptional regulator [Jeotgalibacillus proteolyticus]PPA69978.1 sigma-54-dependent Fis family transcriptional regulator [Jeotgalibacillus proteolyticus]
MAMPKGNFLDIHFVSQALDYIQQGIHVVDTHGRTVLYNQKMRVMESMEDIDILDKRLLEVFKFFPDENSTLLQALTLKEPILNIKQTYFNVHGQEITTLNNTYPIWSKGEVVGAIEIAQDVSSREQLRINSASGTAELSSFDHWTGSSPLIEDMIFAGKQASNTKSMILLTGEAGSGKERLAQCIHVERGLGVHTFYSIDCRALTDDRFNELLNEYNDKKGRRELSTLFIDHIESLDLSLQKQLTDLLADWKATLRITNSPLYYPILTLSEDPVDAIQSGKLDKDLYYTMSEITIFVPSLRNRKKDIPELVTYFIDDFNSRFQTNIQGVTEEIIKLFSSYDWPGNVRELEHVMEASMFAMGQETLLSFTHLPHYFRLKFDDPMASKPALDSSAFMIREGKALQTLDAFLREAESYYIQKSLQYHDYNVTKTADALGMSRQNLQYRLKKNNVIRKK